MQSNYGEIGGACSVSGDWMELLWWRCSSKAFTHRCIASTSSSQFLNSTSIMQSISWSSSADVPIIELGGAKGEVFTGGPVEGARGSTSALPAPFATATSASRTLSTSYKLPQLFFPHSQWCLHIRKVFNEPQIFQHLFNCYVGFPANLSK